MTTQDRYPMAPALTSAASRKSPPIRDIEEEREPHRHESKRVSNGDLRAEQERQRKERAERSKAAAKGGTGDFTFDQLRRQSELLAKVAAKRETTDNIGRAM